MRWLDAYSRKGPSDNPEWQTWWLPKSALSALDRKRIRHKEKVLTCCYIEPTGFACKGAIVGLSETWGIPLCIHHSRTHRSELEARAFALPSVRRRTDALHEDSHRFHDETKRCERELRAYDDDWVEEQEKWRRRVEEALASRGGTVVYYIGVEEGVAKIGTTTHFQSRVAAHRRIWPGLRVLATEPGGRLLESERHQQFADERLSRGRGPNELFRLSPRLQEHIRSICIPLPEYEESA